MIDDIRDLMRERIEQLTAEIGRLQRALAELDSGTAPHHAAPQRTAPRPTAPGTHAPANRVRVAVAAPDRHVAAGETRSAVLAVLAGGEALTAGEVAARTGVPRGTVSPLLSQLAKRGEVQRAERGYRLPDAAAASRPPDA